MLFGLLAAVYLKKGSLGHCDRKRPGKRQGPIARRRTSQIGGLIP